MNKNNTLLFDPPHILSPDAEPPKCEKCGDALCHDWNSTKSSYVVPAGFIHHIGCDCEECPKCHRQMMMCFCSEEIAYGIENDYIAK
jgi:hypothetical protein